MRSGIAIAAVVAASVLTACARTVTPTATVDRSDAPRPTDQPSAGAPGDAWVAVVASADDPGRLGSDRRRVLAALGDALEGSVVVSPGACLAGLPEEYAGGYVLALQRDSRDDLRVLAAQLPQPVSFIGLVTVVCSD